MSGKKITVNMNKKPSNFISATAADYVKNFLRQLPDWAVYHNEAHTLDTVEGCREIGIGSGLNGFDLDAVVTAAWFHDTGYVFAVNGHEEKSCEIASEFLRKQNVDESFISDVARYIMATKNSNTPAALPEYIIRDADLISLGRNDFFEKNNLLKKETELRENMIIGEKEWILRSIKFLNSHKYFTGFAKTKYGPCIKLNLEELEKHLKNL